MDKDKSGQFLGISIVVAYDISRADMNIFEIQVKLQI